MNNFYNPYFYNTNHNSFIGYYVGDYSEVLNTHKKIRIFACSDATISFVNTGDDTTTYDALVLDIKKVN